MNAASKIRGLRNSITFMFTAAADSPCNHIDVETVAGSAGALDD